jgi:ubiquinone biosynthesis protein
VLGDGRLGLLARYLSPGMTPDVRVFSDLFRIVSDYGLAIPPEVAAVFRALATLLPMLRRLPRRVERIASAAEHGRLSVHVRLFADERDRRTVTGLLH